MVTKEETALIVACTNNLPEKVSPISMIHASSTDREGNSSIVPEKPSEDGYNWRKYGQKNVKGNEYIRSYYKCSHPNCQVKKQVERSHNGRITDITYLGNHDHVKPHSDFQAVVPSLLSVKVQIPDSSMVVADEDTPSEMPASTTEHVEKVDVGKLAIVKVSDSITRAPLTPSSQVRDDHGDDNLTLKKRKKGIDGADSTPEKANHESRVVVRTVSVFDIVNDGYRWRKYGQKMVKGNPYPRSYYRCSTTGCQVKKHVERASDDPKVVITTYEGEHDHSVPPIRTIVPQATGPSGHGIESNGPSQSKSEESQQEKSDSIEPSITTKPEKKLTIVVKTQDPNEETSQMRPITETAQEEKAQTAEPDVVPENVLSECSKKPEIVSTEAKIHDAKSNGLQRPTREVVNF